MNPNKVKNVCIEIKMAPFLFYYDLNFDCIKNFRIFIFIKYKDTRNVHGYKSGEMSRIAEREYYSVAV